MPFLAKSKAGNTYSSSKTITRSKMGSRTRSGESSSTSSSTVSASTTSTSARTVSSFDAYLEELASRSLSTIYSEDEIEKPFDEASDFGDQDNKSDRLLELSYPSFTDDDMTNSEICNINNLDLDDCCSIPKPAISPATIATVPPASDSSTHDDGQLPYRFTMRNLSAPIDQPPLLQRHRSKQRNMWTDDRISPVDDEEATLNFATVEHMGLLRTDTMDESVLTISSDGADSTQGLDPSETICLNSSKSDIEVHQPAADEAECNQIELIQTPVQPAVSALKSKFKYTTTMPKDNRQASSVMSSGTDDDRDRDIQTPSHSLHLLSTVQVRMTSPATSSIIGSDDSLYELPPPPLTSDCESVSTPPPPPLPSPLPPSPPSLPNVSVSHGTQGGQDVEAGFCDVGGSLDSEEAFEIVYQPPKTTKPIRSRRLGLWIFFFLLFVAVSATVGVILGSRHDTRQGIAAAAESGNIDESSSLEDNTQDKESEILEPPHDQNDHPPARDDTSDGRVDEPTSSPSIEADIPSNSTDIPVDDTYEQLTNTTGGADEAELPANGDNNTDIEGPLNNESPAPENSTSTTDTEAPSQSPTCETTISVDDSCYKIGVDNIRITLDICRPLHDDWIGIFRVGSTALDTDGNHRVGDDYLEWSWTCGTRSCLDEDEDGNAISSGPVSAITLPSESLQINHRYHVYLVRDGPGAPYTSDSRTQEFTVANTCP